MHELTQLATCTLNESETTMRMTTVQRA